MASNPNELTGTDVARGSVLLSVSSFLGIGIRLATMVVLTRELGVHDYGLYILAYSVQLAVGSGYFLGAGRAVMADISREIGLKQYGRVRRLLTEYTGLQLVLGLLLAGGVAIFIPIFGDSLLHERAPEWLGLIAVLVAMTALNRIASVGLTSHGNFGVIAAQQLLEVIARLIAIVVLVFGMDRGVSGVLEADIVALAVGQAVSWVILIRSTAYLRFHAPHPGWILPGILKAHGKWTVLTSMFTQLTESAANWVMAGILNTEAVGIYAVGKRSVGFAKAVLPLKTVLPPLMARRVSDPAQIRRLFVKSLQYRVQLNLVMALVGGALAYPVFRFGFPEFFPLVVPVFLLLLLRYVLNAYNMVTNPLVEALQAQRISFSMTVIRRVLYFALSPGLMLGLGVVGAAVETVIAAIVMSLVKYRLIAKLNLNLKIDAKSFLRFDADDRQLVKGLLMGKLRRSDSRG